MAYNHEAPYVDPYRFNTDWEMATVQETKRRMDELEVKEQEFENNINKQWSDFQTTIQNNFKIYQEQTNALIQQWKNNTLESLEAWKSQTSTALGQQYQQFTNNVNGEIARFESSVTQQYNNLMSEFHDLSGEFAGLHGEFTTLSNTMALYRTQINQDIAGFKTTIQNDMTTFQNNVNQTLQSYHTEQVQFETDINGKIDTQNGKLAEMQTQINEFSADVPDLVNSYLATLTPAYNIAALRAQYPNIAGLIGHKIALNPLMDTSQTFVSQITNVLHSVGSEIVPDNQADTIIMLYNQYFNNGDINQLHLYQQNIFARISSNNYVIQYWPETDVDMEIWSAGALAYAKSLLGPNAILAVNNNFQSADLLNYYAGKLIHHNLVFQGDFHTLLAGSSIITRYVGANAISNTALLTNLKNFCVGKLLLPYDMFIDVHQNYYYLGRGTEIYSDVVSNVSIQSQGAQSFHGFIINFEY